MYLPQEAQKSSTAAFDVIGGEFPDLPPMPSKTAHKSLIDFLSFGFEKNKKGLDSSVFTFRENH